MNLRDQATCTRTTDAATALDQAHQCRDDLGRVDRTGLADAVGHLTEIAACLATTLDQCAHGADNLTKRTDDPALVEVHHATHQAATTAGTAARSLRRTMISARSVARTALTTRAPQHQDQPPLTGQAVRDLLEVAARGLCHNVHPVTDPAALATIVTATDRITDRVIDLIGQCATAAAGLATRSGTEASVTAHRTTEHALGTAVTRARVLRGRLGPLQTCVDRGHELTHRRPRRTTT